MSRIRVGVLFGGRSGEHEVSLASATSILEALDPQKYEAVPIGISRRGEWLITGSPRELLAGEVTRELPDATEVLPDPTHHALLPVNGRGFSSRDTAVDVVFPALHGPHGEDGTVQGLLEVAGIPYVGSGVLASAVSMDKATMKALFQQAGLPSVPYLLVEEHDWQRRQEEILDSVESALSYPVFVKPCNLGSSVGISKVLDRASLGCAIELAHSYDARVIVEQGVDAREVECSVLGNDDPAISVAGEIISHRDFYDYEAKYSEGLADLIIPARLTAEQALSIRDLAARAFRAVSAAGLARVDFFIRRSDGAVLVNEINTMPGFTATSMFPKLWEASGVAYPELVDRLIELAFQRHQQRQKRSVSR